MYVGEVFFLFFYSKDSDTRLMFIFFFCPLVFLILIRVAAFNKIGRVPFAAAAAAIIATAKAEIETVDGCWKGGTAHGTWTCTYYRVASRLCCWGFFFSLREFASGAGRRCCFNKVIIKVMRNRFV